MSALAETAGRVRALGQHLGFTVGTPVGPGWFVVSSLVEGGLSPSTGAAPIPPLQPSTSTPTDGSTTLPS